MIPNKDFEQAVNGVRYNVGDSIALAHDYYFDGHSFERKFRNTWLYRTQDKRYFLVHLSLWPNEDDYVEPVTEGDAYFIYEKLPVKEESIEVAFPHYV